MFATDNFQTGLKRIRQLVTGRLLWLLLSLLISTSLTAAETWDIGGLFTRVYHDGRPADWGEYALQAARMAVRDINESGMLGADKLAFKDANMVDYHCWPDNVERLATPLFQRELLALVGAGCSSPATRIATIGNDYKTPVISYGANSENLSNRSAFPWLLRTVTPGSRYDSYLVDIAVQYGKQRVALLYTTDDWGLGAKASVQSRAEQHGVTLETVIGYPRNTPVASVQKILTEKLADNVDAVLIIMPTPDTVTAFKALGRADLNRPNRMVLAGEMFSADESPEVVRHARGYMAPIARLPDSPALSGFHRSFSEYMGVSPGRHSKAFIYAALSYDSVMVIANGLQAAKDSGEPRINGQVLMPYLRKVAFSGVSGHIAFQADSNDRAMMDLGIMKLEGLSPDGTETVYTEIGRIHGESGRFERYGTPSARSGSAGSQ